MCYNQYKIDYKSIMKIAIIGSGNAGCLTALHYGLYTRNSGVEIELIHTKDIPAEPVGQGTLTEPPELFWKALGFNWYNNPIYGTFKTGILYENWGSINEKVFHPFPSNNMAMHYSPSDMQEYVLKSSLFKVTEKEVENFDDIDADYIFDCRGKPKDFSDYNKLKSPVNSVILGKPKWDLSNQYWTRSVATPDGWCFVIPANIKSKAHDNCVGYLYNNEITSYKEAEDNFSNLFDVSVSRDFSFDNYVAKNPVIDNRIILSGNRFFFLEPLESTAVQAYLRWARLTFDVLITKARSFEDITLEFMKYIEQTQNFILWHYKFGSKYKSKFWDYAQSISLHDPELDNIINYCKNMNDFDILPQNYGGISNNQMYSHFYSYSIKNWYDGMTHKNDY